MNGVLQHKRCPVQLFEHSLPEAAHGHFEERHPSVQSHQTLLCPSVEARTTSVVYWPWACKPSEYRLIACCGRSNDSWELRCVCRLRFDTVSEAGPAVVALLVLLSVPARLPRIGGLLVLCAPSEEASADECSWTRALTGEEATSGRSVTSSSIALLDSSSSSDIDSVIRSLLPLCVPG